MSDPCTCKVLVGSAFGAFVIWKLSFDIRSSRREPDVAKQVDVSPFPFSRFDADFGEKSTDPGRVLLVPEQIITINETVLVHERGIDAQRFAFIGYSRAP